MAIIHRDSVRQITRQISILRTLEASRLGKTIDELAAECNVTTRTIRRDIEALSEAGIAVWDEESPSGSKRWKLNSAPLKALSQTTFTLSELCALYLGRTLIDGLPGIPFQAPLRDAFGKLESAIAPKMRQFLARLPTVIAAKSDPGKRSKAADPEFVDRLLEATAEHRQVRMRYHSLAHNRAKDYAINPHRLVYAQGGFYLIAFVPEYGETRTFAVDDRVTKVSIEETVFEPPAALADEVFAESLGIFTGKPVPVEIEFSAHAAPYVRKRQYHASQKLKDGPDGTLRMRLNVCADWTLKSLVLSFGPDARVISPAWLAEDILGQLEEARAHYRPRMDFGLPALRPDPRAQRTLPFTAGGSRSRPRRASL
jgi:predicted DNA-binding transcriptional regulator YafY